MRTSRAHVETQRAPRYLAQLCRHFSNLRRHESRGREHETAQPPDIEVHVEWQENHGTITFPWGRCTLNATADGLALAVEAPDEPARQRIEDLVGSHVERFGERDHLTVNWQSR